MNTRLLKWVALLVLLALVAAGAWRAWSARQAQQEALALATAGRQQTVVELAATDVARAQRHQLTQGLPISGSLKAVNSALVKARAAGELQGLAVREGDRVQAGQVIARIESTEYAARVRQVQEQADAAKAQIDIAQRQWNNNKALVDQGFISRTALDTSLNNLNAAQANHQAALAAVEVARKSLDDTVVRAPIAGFVAQRLAQPGERVGVEARIVEIVDLSRLELEATLSAADSLAVRVGQEAQLQVEGKPEPVRARVARINPSAQPGSRSVLAYLAIEAPAGLRQGLFAQGTLHTGEVRAIAVPLAAVRTDKPAPYVQVVANDVVAHRTVEPGARGAVGTETMVAVTGLNEGALVLRSSVGPLREGTPVRFTGGHPHPSPLPQAGEGASPPAAAPRP
ncbi:efflux RND transporter periplasmic adaptor subunit [Ramlibacter sp. RBP-2]|uniref:Efflux RND transporter periplasmic adaptor subunit n=1 Tax=Ramlibacter lithotrophicus TaxID=2606681 RepID=A0A7X6DKY5_9BURK|nr:efflux RND transporter periplasmic adaptor subunit [Ramlibacter lithotrophicus]NKE69089.1 efflux RND transporter periplasmic adaptor subunit [Ramlibacter lithotrophicus]